MSIAGCPFTLEKCINCNAQEQRNMGGLSVLVVEDEAIIAMLFSEVLEGMGQRAQKAAPSETIQN
jgi:hypothetical protein